MSPPSCLRRASAWSRFWSLDFSSAVTGGPEILSAPWLCAIFLSLGASSSATAASPRVRPATLATPAVTAARMKPRRLASSVSFSTLGTSELSMGALDIISSCYRWRPRNDIEGLERMSTGLSAGPLPPGAPESCKVPALNRRVNGGPHGHYLSPRGRTHVPHASAGGASAPRGCRDAPGL